MLHKRIKNRIVFLILLFFTTSVLIFLILNNLKKNILYFLTPSELILKDEIIKRDKIRIGGMVKVNSVKINQKDIQFIITDTKNEIIVNYSGAIPNLFVEGKGVIAEGELKDKNASWLVEGIGEDFLPSISDFSRVNKAYAISDDESFRAARELLKKEGLLAGSSSGTLLAAAIKYCKEQNEEKNVVSFACDTGNKYLSKCFNDFWLEDQGFLMIVDEYPRTILAFVPFL